MPFATSAGQIVALAFVAGLANGFFRPAVYAGVPNLVPDEMLGAANALLQTVENVSWAVGPVIGGLVAAAWGPDTAYWINAGTFLVSAVLVSRIPKRLLQSSVALTRGHWTDLKDGYRAVLTSRPLLAVLLAWGIAQLGSGAINVSEVFMAKNTLDAGDFGYGLLYGGIGLGLVLGSFWSSAIIDRIGIARAYSGGLGVIALGFGLGAFSPSIWGAAAFCVVGGIGNGMAVVCNALLVQRGASDEMRGRALTFVMSATFTATGIGIVLAGALMPPDGARWVWFLGGICCAVAAAVAYVLMRAGRRPRLQPPKCRGGRAPRLDTGDPRRRRAQRRPARTRARDHPRRERRPAGVRPRPRDLIPRPVTRTRSG